MSGHCLDCDVDVEIAVVWDGESWERLHGFDAESEKHTEHDIEWTE